MADFTGLLNKKFNDESLFDRNFQFRKWDNLFDLGRKFLKSFRDNFNFRLFEMTLKQTTSMFAIKVILNSVNTFLVI